MGTPVVHLDFDASGLELMQVDFLFLHFADRKPYWNIGIHKHSSCSDHGTHTITRVHGFCKQNSWYVMLVTVVAVRIKRSVDSLFHI